MLLHNIKVKGNINCNSIYMVVIVVDTNVSVMLGWIYAIT